MMIALDNGAKTMSKKATNLLAGAALVGLLATSASIAPVAAQDEAKPAKPHIDLAFCIDTTGSMQSEIENVKAKTKELVAKLAGGKPSPVIRVGLVAYRDKGDEYVTKVFPFNEDIDKVVKDITSLKADGGGDAPEAVSEGLHVAVNDLKWSDDSKTLKLLFLIGDAGPHTEAKDFDYKKEAKSAIAHGIQVNTLGCQGLERYSESEGVGVFKEIAKLSDGKYESLAYHQTVIGADGKKTEVVASGGRMYKVSREADWKAGVDKLSVMGAAEAMPASTAMYPARLRGFTSEPKGFGYTARAASPAYYGTAGGAGGARVRDYAAAAKNRPAFAAASVAEESFAAPSAASVSRADNNLADVIYAATKDAAAKKLKVEFKDR
jgi:hypothetical protein